jgi:serine/threonine protein kinase
MLKTPPSDYWKKHEEFPQIGLRFPIKSPDGKAYFLDVIDGEIGHGAYGVTYRAELTNPRDEIIYGRIKPKYIVKQYFIFDMQRPELALSHAYHEFYTARYLERLDIAKPSLFEKSKEEKLREAKLNGMCVKFAACAIDMFVDLSQNLILTVFPFDDAQNLDAYMTNQFYQSFATDPLNYRKQVLNISKRVCGIVKILNDAEIYHDDIKATNMIVNAADVELGKTPVVTELKFIDFGETCMDFQTIAKLQQPGDTPDMMEHMLCDTPHGTMSASYRGTEGYRDPAAKKVYKYDNVKILWPLFEMYSCAVVMQHLIDPHFRMLRPVRFVKTERSTTEFSDLIDWMTVPLTHERTGEFHTWVGRPHAANRGRPSWEQVMTRLEEIEQNLE